MTDKSLASVTIQEMFAVVTTRYQALMRLLPTGDEALDLPAYQVDLAVRDLKTASDLLVKAVRDAEWA